MVAETPNSGLSNFLRALNRLAWYLEGAGGWDLGYPTNIIVAHLVEHLPPDDARRLVNQLANRFFQEREPTGRITRLLFNELDPSSLMELPKYRDCLFRIPMSVANKKEHANVVFAEGRLYMVELSKPLKFFKDKTIALGEVSIGNATETISRTLDRLEHGRDKNET